MNSGADRSTHAGIAVLIKNNSATGISACFLYLFGMFVFILVFVFQKLFSMFLSW